MKKQFLPAQPAVQSLIHKRSKSVVTPDCLIIDLKQEGPLV